MKTCTVPWCVALAQLDSAHCAVHQKRGPGFRVIESRECESCDGDGECAFCHGSGDCTCECGDEHECHECDGSGVCVECQDADQTLSAQEKRYVEWASEVFEPRITVVTYPWDGEVAA